MQTQLYTEIRDLIKTIPGIKTVKRWKNQLENPDTINALPAVYIEFPNIQYETMTRNVQESVNVPFVLHLVVEKYNSDSDSEDERIYELSQAIYKKLQLAKPLSRQYEVLDTAPEKVEDFRLGYLIDRVEDCEAQATPGSASRPTFEPETEFE